MLSRHYTQLRDWLQLASPGLLAALPPDITVTPDAPSQEAPSLPFDRLPTDHTLLVPAGETAPDGEIRVDAAANGEGLLLHNGALSVRLPADGYYDGDSPGPIVAWRLGDGPWRGVGSVRGLPCRSAVRTTVDSLGPCAVQWTTEWRWGSSGSWRFQARWALGADTLEVADTITEDSAATWEWQPARPVDAAAPASPTDPARAWVDGGGEGPGVMRQLAWRASPWARSTAGRKLLTPIAHISYFNQWCKSWVAFEHGDGVVAGIFAGWGGLWHLRGHVRPLVWQDPDGGALLQLPIRAGRRCYGLVFAETDVDATAYCLLNLRKRAHSDFSPAKTRHWELALPVPARASQLLPVPLPAGLPCRPVAELREIAERTLVSARGGYEGIIIFDGRRLKSIAFDLDAMWAEGTLTEAEYQDFQRILLLAAYVFADPDYCTYGDFWPHLEPGEGIAEALRNEMGDAPVPPNFASEFFSTTGLVAELYSMHPMAEAWRAFSVAMTARFLDVYFAGDGTYAESINYHTHALSELLAHFYPLLRNGGEDFFRHPAVRGSYQGIVDLQMPHIAAEGCAPLPASGNSGKYGKQQPFRGELVIGIDAYRESHPALAAQLAHAWETGGRPGPEADHEHPVLTAALLAGPALPTAVPPPLRSAQRHTLGVVSRAVGVTGATDKTPVWAFFRAGKATHHMDFDQGHLMIAAGDRVLLGDHGYHTKDSDGKSLPAAATWLHSTLTYADDTTLSCGYTGLELAPDPTTVHLDATFDWCVLPIVNTDFRDLSRLSYMHMVPTPPIHHTRHYLHLKPDLFVLWDTLDMPPADDTGLSLCPTFWLHAHEPWHAVGEAGTAWHAGAVEDLHLDVAFATPTRLNAFMNRQVGPQHALGLRRSAMAAGGAADGERRAEFLAVLRPTQGASPLSAQWAADRRVLTIVSGTERRTLQLPVPGSETLPKLVKE